MRVLMTGVAGFFGSRAAACLLRDGVEVHGLDHPKADLARVNALAPKTIVHAVDLADRTATAAIVRELRPDVAVHLAWYAVPGKYLPAPENMDHLAAALDLARALNDAGCKRLITAGTCFEYDTDKGLLAESTPTAPRFLYSAAKLAMYEVLREASRVWSTSYAHLRFFYQYGPWEAPGRIVPAVMTALLRGEEASVTPGQQVRDFLHVEDVARAIAFVTKGSLEGIVNIGSGVPVRIREIVAAAARAVGREDLVRYGALPTRPGDPPFVCADASKLRAAGWAPMIDLESGMADTAAYWRGQLATTQTR